MTTIDLEKITALPLVKDAIRQQAEAIEADSLAARAAVLDSHQQADAVLAALNTEAAEFDAMQDELDRQRDELSRQRDELNRQRQHVETQRRTHARELRDTHGGRLVADTVRMLTAHAASLRHEAEYQRGLRERKTGWMGRLVEGPSPAAMEKAAELDSRAGQIEQARDAIVALQFARIAPQRIEADIRARLEALGFSLNTISVMEGWRVEGWEGKPKTTKAA
jgi:hypothetical protein